MATINHNGYTLHPRFGQYGNRRTAIQLLTPDDEPYTTITVNLPDTALEPGCFFIKNWGENERIIPALLDAGWLEDTGFTVPSGYVFVPIMKLTGDLYYALEASEHAELVDRFSDEGEDPYGD